MIILLVSTNDALKLHTEFIHGKHVERSAIVAMKRNSALIALSSSSWLRTSIASECFSIDQVLKSSLYVHPRSFLIAVVNILVQFKAL